MADLEYMYGNEEPDVAGSWKHVHVRQLSQRLECTYLGPAVHTRCHHNLGSEPCPTRDRLPLLEQGEEREGEPVWADCVRMEAVLKVLLGDFIEVRLSEGFCVWNCGLRKLPYDDARQAIWMSVEDQSLKR